MGGGATSADGRGGSPDDAVESMSDAAARPRKSKGVAALFFVSGTLRTGGLVFILMRWAAGLATGQWSLTNFDLADLQSLLVPVRVFLYGPVLLAVGYGVLRALTGRGSSVSVSSRCGG